MSGITGAAAKVGRTRRGLLPSGQLLTPEVWERRPRGIIWLLTPLVTCSVGLACWDFQEGGAELIQRADQALYTAKAEGRNRHVLAS